MDRSSRLRWLGLGICWLSALTCGCSSTELAPNNTTQQPGLTTTAGSNTIVWPVGGTDVTCSSAPSANVTSIAVAPTGEIYLAGDYKGPADFGSGPLPNSLDTRLFLAKFDAIGNPVWVQSFSGNQAIVSVDHAARPVMAATNIIETNSGGAGTLRQLDPNTGNIQWEYPYSWQAGYFAPSIALTAGQDTILAIPGALVKIDSAGKVLYNTVISPSDATQQAGYPVALSEAQNGELAMYMVDYVTWAPLIYQYRLTSFDSQGNQRWTRRVEASINQVTQMVGSVQGTMAVFGTFYGNVAIEGASPINRSDVFFFLGTVDMSGNVLAQRDLSDFYASAGTWRNDTLLLVNLTRNTDTTLYDIQFSTFSASGATLPSIDPALPSLDSPSVLLAPQGNNLLVAGSRGTAICADCTECHQARPYLMRIDSNGARDPNFGELMP